MPWVCTCGQRNIVSGLPCLACDRPEIKADSEENFVAPAGGSRFRSDSEALVDATDSARPEAPAERPVFSGRRFRFTVADPTPLPDATAPQVNGVADAGPTEVSPTFFDHGALAPEADVHNSEADVHNSDTDVHNSEADVHNSEADVHNSEADVHNSDTDVHNSDTDVHNSDTDVHNGEADVAIEPPIDQPANASAAFEAQAETVESAELPAHVDAVYEVVDVATWEPDLENLPSPDDSAPVVADAFSGWTPAGDVPRAAATPQVGGIAEQPVTATEAPNDSAPPKIANEPSWPEFDRRTDNRRNDDRRAIPAWALPPTDTQNVGETSVSEAALEASPPETKIEDHAVPIEGISDPIVVDEESADEDNGSQHLEMSVEDAPSFAVDAEAKSAIEPAPFDAALDPVSEDSASDLAPWSLETSDADQAPTFGIENLWPDSDVEALWHEVDAVTDSTATVDAPKEDDPWAAFHKAQNEANDLDLETNESVSVDDPWSTQTWGDPVSPSEIDAGFAAVDPSAENNGTPGVPGDTDDFDKFFPSPWPNAEGPENWPNAEGPENWPNAEGPENWPNAEGPENWPNAEGPENWPNAEGPENWPNAEGPENWPNAEGPEQVAPENWAAHHEVFETPEQDWYPAPDQTADPNDDWQHDASAAVQPDFEHDWSAWAENIPASGSAADNPAGAWSGDWNAQAEGPATEYYAPGDLTAETEEEWPYEEEQAPRRALSGANDPDPWWDKEANGMSRLPSAFAQGDNAGRPAQDFFYDDEVDLDEPDEYELEDHEWSAHSDPRRAAFRENAPRPRPNQRRQTSQRRPPPRRSSFSSSGNGLSRLLSGNRAPFAVGTVVLVVVVLLLVKNVFASINATPDATQSANATCAEVRSAKKVNAAALQQYLVPTSKEWTSLPDLSSEAGAVNGDKAIGNEPDQRSAVDILDKSRFQAGYARSYSGGGAIQVKSSIYEFDGAICASTFVGLHGGIGSQFPVADIPGALGTVETARGSTSMVIRAYAGKRAMIISIPADGSTTSGKTAEAAKSAALTLARVQYERLIASAK